MRAEQLHHMQAWIESSRRHDSNRNLNGLVLTDSLHGRCDAAIILEIVLRAGLGALLLLLLQAIRVVRGGVHGNLLQEKDGEHAATSEAEHDLPHDRHRCRKRDTDLSAQWLVQGRNQRDGGIGNLNTSRELCNKGWRKTLLEFVL